MHWFRTRPGRRFPRSSAARTSRYRPLLEPLEDRWVPAAILVTTTADNATVDGSVSLREAILSINQGANVNADVNAVGPYGTDDTIQFAIPGTGVQTINLNSALPALTAAVTIN